VTCKRCQQELPVDALHIPYPFPDLTECLQVSAFTSAECPAWEDGRHSFQEMALRVVKVDKEEGFVTFEGVSHKGCACGAVVKRNKT
jgi:hypothetical protein